jgi:drug/metabolite transporter (DMT)-like permease
VLFASAAFASSGPLSRWARPTPPLLLAFGRLALAALVLFALDARRLVTDIRRLAPAHRLTVFAAGALLAAHFALFQLGIDHTSLPAAVSLVSLEPLAVVLSAWFFLGVRPSPVEQIAVGFATAGALIVARGQGEGDHRVLGDLLVLGAVALYGGYLTVARALRDALPARSYATLVYASAALSLGLVLALGSALSLRGVTGDGVLMPRGLLAIVALAFIPTLLGHTAVQTAARTLSPSIVALVSPGETLGAIAIGAALLGARPTATEMTGAMIILVGAALALVAPRRRPAVPVIESSPRASPPSDLASKSAPVLAPGSSKDVDEPSP